MLVSSIFSFSHNVFKWLFLQGHYKSGLCGKELNLFTTKLIMGFIQQYAQHTGVILVINPFPNKPWLKNKSFENTVGKGEIACNKQFLLFSQCFLPIWRTFCHFLQIQNCRLQTLSVWKYLKFDIWERVKRQGLNIAYYSTNNQLNCLYLYQFVCLVDSLTKCIRFN